MTPPDNRPDSVDYDTFMRGDVQTRIRTFNEVSAENRADLVATHIRRWIDANKHRLSDEQLGITGEWLRFVTPDAYSFDKSEDARAQLKELETRSAALFSREDMGQALTIHGRHIPPTENAE